MGKKFAVKLESSRAGKTKKETGSKAPGSPSSGIKRELEDSDATIDDNQSSKRMRTLDLNEGPFAPSLASSIAALKVAFQNNPLLGTSNLQTEYMVPPSHRPAALAMSIFEVRLTIFKHLPVSSLLQFALVCKDWYDETRSVLEKFKTCAAFIPGHQPCVDLLSLNNEIPWMTRIPFNSLNIKVFRDHQPCVSSHRKLDMEKFLGNILTLPLKSLEMNRKRWMDSHCLASALLREVFRGRYPTIEKMIFPLLPPWRVYPREEDIFKEMPLPNLKYLECRMHNSSSKPLFLLALQVAPNIQDILTPFEVSSSKNELEFMTSYQQEFVKWLLLEPITSVRPSIQRLADCSCGLRRLEVLGPIGDMMTDKHLIMAVDQLLECSRLTLEYLSLANHEQMLRLDRTVKPFPSLKYFQISIASMTDQLPAILDRFRLGKLFPNLIGLRIFFNQLSAKQAADLDPTMDTSQGFENDGNFQLWPRLTRLEFHVSPARSFSYGIFDHFAQKCPQITEFVYAGLGDKFLNYQIFTCFPQLKRLKLIVTANHVTNLDEIICGLDAEEVKDLRELPVEKLRQIHVVPRRHCISNLTGLKHFKLVICGAESLRGNLIKQRSIMSQVTAVLIFSRWPSLRVEINCHLYKVRYPSLQSMSHLSPFAKVTNIERYH